MADELYNCIAAVKALMTEISIVKKTHKGFPNSIVTGCEVAVLSPRARQENYGAQTNCEWYRIPLRGYVPMGASQAAADEKLQKLWNLCLDKIIKHVNLDGTATRCNLEMGRWGYRTVAGAKCRTLDMTLHAQLVQEQAYA